MILMGCFVRERNLRKVGFHELDCEYDGVFTYKIQHGWYTFG